MQKPQGQWGGGRDAHHHRDGLVLAQGLGNRLGRASPRRERSGPSEQTPPEGQVPPALPQEERRPAGSPSQGRQVQPGEVQGWCCRRPLRRQGETRAVSGVASPVRPAGQGDFLRLCRTTSCCPGRVTSTGAARKESWRGTTSRRASKDPRQAPPPRLHPPGQGRGGQKEHGQHHPVVTDTDKTLGNHARRSSSILLPSFQRVQVGFQFLQVLLSNSLAVVQAGHQTGEGPP